MINSFAYVKTYGGYVFMNLVQLICIIYARLGFKPRLPQKNIYGEYQIFITKILVRQLKMEGVCEW
jgi:hypothetical protein